MGLREQRLNRPGAIALVTGASSGIGEAVATRLARERLRVVLVARRAERLEELARRLAQAGGEALPLPADLSQESERERVLAATREACGPPDILINNAGFGWYGYTREMPWALAYEMLATNVAAVVHLTLLALPDMLERGQGHIINVSSVAGSIPSQGIALYSATKAFLDAFTTGLHRELRGSGVHVSALRPGPVRGTGFYDAGAARAAGQRIPAERFGVTTEAVARAVWSLLERPRRVRYVPAYLALVPWIETGAGWLMDRLGPALLQRGGRGGG
jgi:short-subunit dehydrogenase